MKARPATTRAPLPTRVLCVDDNPDMTAVMRIMIEAEPTMECVGCLESADGLLDAVRRLSLSPAVSPLVVVLDATMPGMRPLKVMNALAAEFPAIKTIIYSGHDDPAFIEQAMSAGAWGCVSKREEPETLMRAVRAAASGAACWQQTPRTG